RQVQMADAKRRVVINDAGGIVECEFLVQLQARGGAGNAHRFSSFRFVFLRFFFCFLCVTCVHCVPARERPVFPPRRPPASRSPAAAGGGASSDAYRWCRASSAVL